LKLTLSQTAQLFGVNENSVTRWVQQENLPVYEANEHYRFDGSELLEWAALKRIELCPAFFQTVGGFDVTGPSLADAIERGGVAPSVPGLSREEVLHFALRDMVLPDGVCRETLCELLAKREKAVGTAIGFHVAIPHSRYPIIFPGAASLVRVCYLQNSLDFHASDWQPVRILFLMFCGTMHEHLQLLARLVAILQNSGFRNLLSANPAQLSLCQAVRAAEVKFLRG
jgi:PTS system nitrogen regulatory IIA component